MITTTITTPLGDMTAAAEAGSLKGLWFLGQAYYPDTSGWAAVGIEDDGVFVRLQQWLEGYFAGSDAPCGIPLSPGGTDFQQAVWDRLRAIPYGATATYGGIARAMAEAGQSTSARAVGSAVGRNPISVIIPCHRVMGADGRLTGYAGGLERKRALLALENVEHK